MLWRAVDVEQLIGEDHPARALWGLVGRLDLDGFYEGIECSAEEGGRPAYDPRLLISLWIYASSQGIGSARARPLAGNPQAVPIILRLLNIVILSEQELHEVKCLRSRRTSAFFSAARTPQGVLRCMDQLAPVYY